MNVSYGQNAESGGGAQTRAVLLEALAVAVVGAVVAFAANAISPRGLKLARDYFPGAIRPGTHTVTNVSQPANVTRPTTNLAEMIAARLKAKDLRGVILQEAEQLFHDPRRASGLVVFVDARDEKLYQAGHVPGAYLFDHYRAEKYLAEVLHVCISAEQIVLYCQGGDCEDSEFAAVTLRQVGVPNEKLNIYIGGFTEWETNAMPVELGTRNSGHIRTVQR